MSTRPDPRFKQELQQSLLEFTYAPAKRIFDKRLAEIITKNTVAQGYSHASFSYKGEYYSFELTHPRFKTNRLLPDFRPEMDKYLQELQEMEREEKPFITGFFNRVLNRSNSMLDYQHMLPECVHRGLVINTSSHIALPREMSDDAVLSFQQENEKLIMQLKARMVMNLII